MTAERDRTERRKRGADEVSTLPCKKKVIAHLHYSRLLEIRMKMCFALYHQALVGKEPPRKKGGE
jgi:hypothetical protein